MKRTTTILRKLPCLAVLLGMACKEPPVPVDTPAKATSNQVDAAARGTADQRRALAQDIIAKTLRREAFSKPKSERLGLDVEKSMQRWVDEVASASSDEALLYALVKLSNARKDRHLKVRPAEGGLAAPQWEQRLAAPIRFAPDFSDGAQDGYFVADLAQHDWGKRRAPQLGDRLVAIGGIPIGEYVERVEPYFRYSTVAGFRWKLGQSLGARTNVLPPSQYPERATYTLADPDDQTYTVEMDWVDPETLTWGGHFDPRYPGFDLVFESPTFDLYRDTPSQVLLLRWRRFGPELVEDMERLMKYAGENRLLANAVIVDATRARGGSKGAHVIQHLSAKPFKTTFGNLRLSDATEAFIKSKQAEHQRGAVNDGASAETMDGGNRLLEWLQNDVTKALAAGEDYSANVPFKLAHLPKDSDGMAQPAEVHFTGPLVVLLSPHGGSHLDQFAAMIVDNDLGHTIGMPAGGYSNTWEWTETLTLPGTDEPLADFMWSIGHTIRPSGEILEGNPAAVAEEVPLTRQNARGYHALLLERAFAHLDKKPRASLGLADETPGAWIYTRRYRVNEDGECTHPPPDPIDATFTHANKKGLWTYVGDDDEELVSFTPGDPAEVSGNPIDTTRELVKSALVRADDFQPVFSTNDGDMNFDAGTGGSVTLRLADGKVIRPDGRKATGSMADGAGSPAERLDGCEILIFEDAEFSGFTVELIGPTQTRSVSLTDYQNDVRAGGFGDDTMTAIDLDTLGWTDPHVEQIKITDDGVTRGARGRCANDEIDTSLELDAVAVRLDTIATAAR